MVRHNDSSYVYLQVATLSKYTHLLIYLITSSPLFIFERNQGAMMVQAPVQLATASIKVVVGATSVKLTVRKDVKVDGALMMAILHHPLHLLLHH